MAYNMSRPIVEIWRYLGGVEEAVFLEAMGFEGMKDEVSGNIKKEMHYP